MISLAKENIAEYCFESFVFASQRLRDKKTSPRTYAFLEYTRNTCVRAYESLKDEYLRVKMATCIKLLHNKAFMLQVPCHLEEDLANELKDLRRLQLLANYGDYAKVKLTDLRVSARKIQKNSDGIKKHTASTVFWTTIHKQLEEETRAVEDRGRPDFDTPENFTPLSAFTHMHYLMNIVCDTLGYDRSYIKHIIALYAERNGQIHSDVAPMIEHCRFIELGSGLFQDREDLEENLEEQDIDDAQDRRDILSTITELMQRYSLCISQYEDDTVLSQCAMDQQYAYTQNRLKKRQASIAKEARKEEKRRHT